MVPRLLWMGRIVLLFMRMNQEPLKLAEVSRLRELRVISIVGVQIAIVLQLVVLAIADRQLQ